MDTDNPPRMADATDGGCPIRYVYALSRRMSVWLHHRKHWWDQAPGEHVKIRPFTKREAMERAKRLRNKTQSTQVGAWVWQLNKSK